VFGLKLPQPLNALACHSMVILAKFLSRKKQTHAVDRADMITGPPCKMTWESAVRTRPPPLSSGACATDTSTMTILSLLRITLVFRDVYRQVQMSGSIVLARNKRTTSASYNVWLDNDMILRIPTSMSSSLVRKDVMSTARSAEPNDSRSSSNP